MIRSTSPLLVLALAIAGCGDPPPSEAQPGTPPQAAYGATPAPPPAAAPAPSAATPAAAAVPATSTTIGSGTLSYPEDMQMILLSYRMRGETPPLEKWAKDNQEVRSANEFNRGQVLQAETQKLNEAYAATGDIGVLKLRTSSTFSEYDSTRGGYYIAAFSPGSVYTFQAQSEKVNFQFSNSSAATFWALDAAAAQDILQRNQSRNVTLDATIALSGIERRSTGPVITGRIVEYTILSTRYGDESVLGQITPR